MHGGTDKSICQDICTSKGATRNRLIKEYRRAKKNKIITTCQSIERKLLFRFQTILAKAKEIRPNLSINMYKKALQKLQSKGRYDLFQLYNKKRKNAIICRDYIFENIFYEKTPKRMIATNMRVRARAIAVKEGKVKPNDNKEVHHVHSVHGRKVKIYDSPRKHMQKHINMLNQIQKPQFVKA